MRENIFPRTPSQGKKFAGDSSASGPAPGAEIELPELFFQGLASTLQLAATQKCCMGSEASTAAVSTAG